MLSRKNQAPEDDTQPDTLFRYIQGQNCKSQGKDKCGSLAVINVMVAVGGTVIQRINKRKVKAGSISMSRTKDDK